ncbi:SDR family oxidoreductase [Bordetella bronchiseptica]|uniref:SDR family oxidoreductase n=1 Tax=Bordetella bronchiseptica TaxID=518 RepID=UPI00028A7684|nr:SDR family oxidoreductase [Bordetella bronchiseptica]KCV24353.1 NAD(P)H-binding protein, PF13460 family [Bordetella bronchiseptica 00-P-2730]KDD59550.1 NAD(P)H-binding protein, PF13460 family [Bordetella bronchiseptica OSU553]AUL14788.1 hypothetical protein BTL45_07790 [Bordetella bronchiseptica]AWP57884.1 hypothetical protein B7P02_07740 [Bordetella bronchiseptica]AWQ04617.1 hypothetical protein B9G73_07700 [Bordetella bronchiseptica]
MKRTALIAGPYGIVGNALVQHLARDAAWDVVTISRRQEATLPGVRHIAADLLDAAQAEAALAAFPGITHVFYCAYAPRPTLGEEAAPNLAMLANLVSAVDRHARGLERVVLVHGTKWYGNHLGPFRTPAREDDARHCPPNFYYDQQDWIAARQRESGRWSWTAFRPHGIFGYALGSPMNHLMALSLYASVMKAAATPLKFPGTPAAFAALNQCTDARLLARAMAWSVDVAACENEAFNFHNGEPERWANLWPAVAEAFGMQAGGVQQIRLAAMMPANEAAWQAICQRQGLRHFPLEAYVNWSFADWVYSNGFDQVCSLYKLRRAGWTEILLFDDMLKSMLSDLRQRKLLPA